MFLDMDYCQLSILINTTVMNILKLKAFFTMCVCVFLAGKENWETVSLSLRPYYSNYACVGF